MERHDRFIQEEVHDPYFTKEKHSDPAVCTKCGVVFRDGIFEWLERPPENARRPLERVIEISPGADRIDVKTTYEHLARRIGEAVHRAFKGELKLFYSEDEKFIRVHWRRDY